jgi:AcrR family transcriptional regulator
MGLREEKKDQQRREILRAAIRLFRERGYDETRIQDIIERVRISEATFFNYFPTKDALLESYAVGRVEAYADLLRSEIDDESRSVPDRIRDLLRIIAGALQQEDRQFMAVVATRSRLFSGGEGTVFERQLLAQGLLVRLFEEGQARGEIRADMEPRALAEALTGAYSFAIVNWLTYSGRDGGLLEPRLMRVADMFLDGCRIAPAKAAARGGERRKAWSRR